MVVWLWGLLTPVWGALGTVDNFLLNFLVKRLVKRSKVLARVIGRLLKKHPFGTISGLFVGLIGVTFFLYVIELQEFQSNVSRIELHLKEEPLALEKLRDELEKIDER